MEFDGMEIPADIEVTVWGSNEHRRCNVCRAECAPEPSGADGYGVRIIYVCRDHGLQSVVDPFEHLR